MVSRMAGHQGRQLTNTRIKSVALSLRVRDLRGQKSYVSAGTLIDVNMNEHKSDM